MNKNVRKEKIVMACRRAWERAGKGKILLGVSGGADSTALFLALVKASVPFEVAHCNFNLRQSESLRDREFVKVLCKNYNIKFNLVDFNVPQEAIKGESTEMTCRRLRYDYFRQLKEEGGFGRIAVAHNADDNIETFFLHALRGSGSRGLKGMEEDTGEILRPLLNYRRREILEFLKSNNQSFVTDSSNLKSEDYRRNFLRNEVFPLLETKWDGFIKAVTNTINLQKRDNRIVEYFTSKALEGVTDFLPWHVTYNFPDSETLIFRFISPFGGTPSIAREMAASAENLLPGKRWNLREGSTALFTRKGILISTIDKKEDIDKRDYKWTKIKPGELEMDTITSAPLTELYLPYGAERYEWRHAGIKMKIKSLGMNGSQPVWKVLKDAGLTPDERKKFNVLVDKATEEPIWLPGIKRSRLHLITQDSEAVYRIEKV